MSLYYIDCVASQQRHEYKKYNFLQKSVKLKLNNKIVFSINSLFQILVRQDKTKIVWKHRIYQIEP